MRCSQRGANHPNRKASRGQCSAEGEHACPRPPAGPRAPRPTTARRRSSGSPPTRSRPAGASGCARPRCCRCRTRARSSGRRHPGPAAARLDPARRGDPGVPAGRRRAGGGGDIDPDLYGAARHFETGPPQPQRDRFELALARAVVQADLPFLAICRGMQVLNVARGGTLIQHLPEAVGHKGHAPETGIVGSHPVQISATSLVGKILGDAAEVPAYHHQAVGRLGKGLSAVAWAEDQVVEAVELQGHRFGLAVQWHPEEGDDRRLFEALVAEAAGR
ncbi:gamma-glutamyl-gamma-aminobutyrate hydrolase family protein [Actinomadura madurae]|uniref:gamma-glutamyl-gamma-aminobutyrate hydrolase family protein n=1 Tax=Actinomadura madurae TaxID=1993 RepID=UPI0027E21DF7|nr:gamma-glutamyl-gamma-aminobutyrate hydrolase family protein [Actinomadura madurae]